MENLTLNIVNEVVDQQESFIVDNDSKAEWALSKIREEKIEMQRMINVCESMINEYKMKIEQVEKSYENKTNYFKQQLQNYFETVDKKQTKTQQTYKLPTGTLKRKFGGVDYKRDDVKLVSWLKDNGYNNYIKVKEEPAWAELKKEIKVVGDTIVDSDGQIVDGVIVSQKPDTFEIEV